MFQVAAQMDVLNEDYTGTGLSFVLEGVGYTDNFTWFNNVAPNTTYQTQMKSLLRVGEANTLNVYTVRLVQSLAQVISIDGQVGFRAGNWTGTLGYATFPYDYAASPQDDGVVINSLTLPGGLKAHYNLGRTLTHEVGHWAGLYHTFQGGCDGEDGDGVDDTPAEAEPAYACPVGRDTCPAAGADPIHNYMDYTYDSCMSEFTPGQVQRMRDFMRVYRGISF